MTIKDVAYPRQAILVSCRSEAKARFSNENEVKDNIIALSWHSPVSFEPELYAIMLSKGRFSYKLIKESKVFVVNFMPFELKKELLFCGRISGRDVDKFEESGLEKEEADTVDCCRIKQALGCLECELVNEIEAGDHVIFIGKVLKTVENKKGKKIFQVKGDSFTTTK